MHEFSTSEEIRRQKYQWLKDELKNYQEVFDLPARCWESKKILDVGANDRRLAAACAIAGFNAEVYSLDSAYNTQQEGYADASMLTGVVELLPLELQEVIDNRTVSRTAEDTGFADGTFDLVIARSVNYETIEQLALRIKELLRVGKEIRFYPLDEENRPQYEQAMTRVGLVMPLDRVEKLTLDCEVRTEAGMRHVKESVLILRKR